MVQDAEEGHRDDGDLGDDINGWTGETLTECTTARDRKSWREVVRCSAVSELQQ